MKDMQLIERNKKERVLVAVIELKRQKDERWEAAEMTEEIKELVKASGGEVKDTILCRIDKPTASILIGEGKAEEIALRCQQGDIDTVVFSEDLKGSQQRNLEELIKLKTIDRTQLILDI